MEKETKNRIAIVILSFVFLTIALVLEIIPNSLGMVFAVQNEFNEIEPVVRYSSYFDVFAIAYALYTPFLSSLLTVASIVLFIIRIFKPYKLRGVCVLLPFIASILSSFHLFFSGSEAVTFSAILITSLLFTVFVFNILDFFLGK
jgi:hypothetical protein